MELMGSDSSWAACCSATAVPRGSLMCRHVRGSGRESWGAGEDGRAGYRAEVVNVSFRHAEWREHLLHEGRQLVSLEVEFPDGAKRRAIDEVEHVPDVFDFHEYILDRTVQVALLDFDEHGGKVLAERDGGAA